MPASGFRPPWTALGRLVVCTMMDNERDRRAHTFVSDAVDHQARGSQRCHLLRRLYSRLEHIQLILHVQLE